MQEVSEKRLPSVHPDVWSCGAALIGIIWKSRRCLYIRLRLAALVKVRSKQFLGLTACTPEKQDFVCTYLRAWGPDPAQNRHGAASSPWGGVGERSLIQGRGG